MKNTFFSQSITAQVTRWLLALCLSLVAVHHCQPLLDVFAEQAMAAGCHQHDTTFDGMHHDMHHAQHHH